LNTDPRNCKIIMSVELVIIIALMIAAYLLYPESKGWSLGLILVALAVVYIELLNKIIEKRKRILTALVFIIIAILTGAAMFWKEITDHSEDVLIAASILALALVLIIFIFPADQPDGSQTGASTLGKKRNRLSCRIHKNHCKKK
jgi:hypothetical protein